MGHKHTRTVDECFRAGVFIRIGCVCGRAEIVRPIALMVWLEAHGGRGNLSLRAAGKIMRCSDCGHVGADLGVTFEKPEFISLSIEARARRRHFIDRARFYRALERRLRKLGC